MFKPLFNNFTKVSILCFDQVTENYWYKELNEAGIPVSIPAYSRNKPVLSVKNQDIFLLIQPDYDQYLTKGFDQLKHLLSNEAKHLFILSNDQRWKEIKPNNSCFYLPEHTHPLELARLLVEKLNLPLVSNKTHYAFSIFSF